jgi:hypothetical protein
VTGVTKEERSIRRDLDQETGRLYSLFIYNVRDEFVVPVSIMFRILWDMTPLRLVHTYQYF